MSTRAHAVDRLLEALSPTLSAELERIINETKDDLEKDFQKRLEAALREAENAAHREAQAAIQKAAAEADANARKKTTEELEEKFRKQLEEATNKIRSEFGTERARLEEQLNQWRAFAEAQRQLADASSQPEILVRFLKIAEPFAAGLAVYVAKADGLAMYKSRGKAPFPEIVSQETIDPEFFFKTVTVRGKTVAAVCAAQPYKADALDFLVATMERTIEVFGMKLKVPPPKPPAITETTVAAAAATAPSAGDEQKAHAEARRTARLLVSEIKLYHESELKSGREQGDIYQRLQKQIDDGREKYNQQVQTSALGSRDYFHEELVRILTENDASLMGKAYPGPMTS
ncbi:MAG: hypothetical protein HY646_06510 [Acidobacteria bacterium]|nr:hypothetical protein [Acidobacteriota bacterium]